MGCLTAREGWPQVAARFEIGHGGSSLVAEERFSGRKLAAGKSIELDTVYLCADADAYAALQHFGDAAAAMSERPVYTGATSLWCSWYAHRRGMTEELVLKNAAVAATYFGPLGMEFMQLDHGWQKGDVTGDWVANEKFPHGLKWLADELKSRYGLKLGVWISLL